MSNPIPPPPFGPAPGQGPTSSAPPPPPAYLQPSPSPGSGAPAPQFQPAPQSPGVPPPPGYGSPAPNYGAPGAPGAFGAQQPYGPQGYQQFGAAPAASATRNISVWNILVGLSGVAVAISIFLHWVSIEVTSESFTANANDIPLQFLWDAETGATSGFPLRWPLVIAGLLMITSAFNLRAKGAALIGSILALVVGLAYLRSANSLFSDTGLGLTDFVGVGAWICIAAAVVGTIGSIGLMTRST